MPEEVGNNIASLILVLAESQGIALTMVPSLAYLEPRNIKPLRVLFFGTRIGDSVKADIQLVTTP